MKTINIFLDDKRVPHETFTYTKNPVYIDNDWLICKDHGQFINAIKDTYVNGSHLGLVSFDHDLSKEHYRDSVDQSSNDKVDYHYGDHQSKTGYDCLNWLLDFCSNENWRRPSIMFHTMNPVGRENMRALLASKKSR